MKTRFYSYMTLLAVATLLAACSSEEEVVNDGMVEANLTLTLADAIDSRTISDGTMVDQLIYAVYEDGQQILRRDDIAIENGQATVKLRLLRDHTYSFAFWAQCSQCDAYNTDDLRAVTINYNGLGNDERRDAFCAALEPITFSGSIDRTVVLTRPFAQLNFGINNDDWQNVNKIAPLTATKLEIAAGVYTALNVMTGEASAPTTAALTFATAALPADKLTVDGVEYNWISMNYILAPQEQQQQQLTSVKLTAILNKNNHQETVEVPFENLPIMRNHRTNIVGTLLSRQADFTVVIDATYGKDHNIMLGTDRWDGTSVEAPAYTEANKTYIVSKASQLAWFQDNRPVDGATIVLSSHFDMMEKPLKPLMAGAKDITIKGKSNNTKQIRFANISGSGHVALFAGVTNLTITNLKVMYATATSTDGASAAVLATDCQGTLTLTKCNVITCTVSGMGATPVIGGMVGTALAGTLTDCHVENTILKAPDATQAVIGSLVGRGSGLTLTGCTATTFYEGGSTPLVGE